jgi:hypothetical protein
MCLHVPFVAGLAYRQTYPLNLEVMETQRDGDSAGDRFPGGTLGSTQQLYVWVLTPVAGCRMPGLPRLLRDQDFRSRTST